MRPTRTTRQTGRLALVAACAVLAALGGPAAGAHADTGGDGDQAMPFTPEEAEVQAALVAAEDDRLNQVRAITAIAPLQGGTAWKQPYRLDTGSGYTLVLTERSNAYTVSDLLELAPQTFVRQSDGSYLLTENIYLNPGAKLKLSTPGGLTLRMASSAAGFVSIVSFGGELTLQGTPQAPLEITSWDPDKDTADTDVRDGRAYIRAIGGQFRMDHTHISTLGFWSGRTGGLSLTGTDRPNTGAIDGPDALPEESETGGEPGEGAEEAEPPRNGDVTALPTGPLETPDTRFTVPDLSYVSVAIADSEIDGNAFGLFISSAAGVDISDTVVRDSLQDGVLLHRFVRSAVVERTVSENNGGDGFILSRATQQVQVTGCTARDNAGNGYTVSGRPLASGPSASGQPVDSYGSNSVSSSVAEGNGRYGIEVLGGFDVGVQNNRVEGGDMGIVARQDADTVSITGNRVTGQERQGISVRDGVLAATVTGNIVDGAATGIYIRDSEAEVRGNTIQDATSHGVSLVGDVPGSVVTFNVIAGVGPSALDTTRSDGGITVKENQTFAWYDTSSFWTKVKHYASPMTLLWVSILLLILFMAMMGVKHHGVRRGQPPRVRHPYDDKRPLPTPPPTEVPTGAQRGRHRVPVMAE
ncbi:right-handed parallel beta-helix repeat-containing protein [Streptomyces aidingensis]|uniref:Right handed beta helix region n=1 Tax=Streptomyces aidingensis TaxID=910347 RepID=A0A1I1Q3R0_9ACTN|nr:right-handed parallel beta-helix repeat-containing protein [Streptomyces aidingensis]SFD16689.1 Right handed beta helix region [Streptomyces aidingensis]